LLNCVDIEVLFSIIVALSHWHFTK